MVFNILFTQTSPIADFSEQSLSHLFLPTGIGFFSVISN
uniref:Uncharacterized protein n=1 Tax=Arundo donax TaxID=35708 RepID=A0A0A9BLU5_ARUDO